MTDVVTDYIDVLEIIEPVAVLEVLESAGIPGVGVPEGGLTGQVLTKTSNSSYDTSWQPVSAGGGNVDSVNGKTGTVVLVKADIGLSNVDNTSDAAKPISSATATALSSKYEASNPAGYVNAAAASAAAPVQSVAGKTGVVSISKADVGLGNADNTSDVAKPVSAAVQTALNSKYDTSNPSGYINAASAPVQSVAGKTGAVSLVKADVGLSATDNTSDADKPVSMAQLAALNAKANLSGATFTGSVSATNISGTNTGDQTNITGNAGTVSTINGLIAAGTNVTITGSGTSGSPYSIAAASTATSPAGSTGQVQYNNGGVFGSSANYFWDATNNRLGILTAAPTHSLTQGNASTGSAHYNTADQTTNFERFRSYWASNIFYLGMEQGGSGSIREMRLGNSGQLRVTSSASGGFVQINASVGSGGSTISLITGTQSAVSGIQTIQAVNPVINQSGTAGYTAISVNATETSVGSGNKRLMDLQVGSASKHYVANDGLTFFANLTAPSATPSGGGFLFVEGGSLKYKGSSGTVTIVAPA